MNSVISASSWVRLCSTTVALFVQRGTLAPLERQESVETHRTLSSRLSNICRSRAMSIESPVDVTIRGRAILCDRTSLCVAIVGTSNWPINMSDLGRMPRCMQRTHRSDECVSSKSSEDFRAATAPVLYSCRSDCRAIFPSTLALQRKVSSRTACEDDPR